MCSELMMKYITRGLWRARMSAIASIVGWLSIKIVWYAVFVTMSLCVLLWAAFRCFWLQLVQTVTRPQTNHVLPHIVHPYVPNASIT